MSKINDILKEMENIPSVYPKSGKINAIEYIPYSKKGTVININENKEYESYYIDTNIGTRFYRNKGFKDKKDNLSNAGIRVLMLIADDLPVNKRQIYIPISKYAKRLKCSMVYIYSGINNLIENDFISKYKNSIYWINIDYMFNGNKAEYFRHRNDTEVIVVSRKHKKL